jgi:NADH-quinone oxidoreductase subunit E
VIDVNTEAIGVRERRALRPPEEPAESRIDEIIEKYGGERRWLINILFEIQTEYRYLPKRALEQLSQRMAIPLIDIYGIATFYKAFTLQPRGQHTVTVCLGTACHVRGSTGVLEELQRELGVCPGQTTQDQEFSLETVNCLGCCAQGPMVVMDDEYHGQMTPAKVRGLLSAASKKV